MAKRSVSIGIGIMVGITIMYVGLMLELGSFDLNQTELAWTIVGSILLYSIFIWVASGIVFAKALAPMEIIGGVEAQAKVISVEDTGTTINNMMYILKVTVQVQSDTYGYFEATIQAPVSRIVIPRSGDVVTVIFDPQDHQQIGLKSL